LVPDCSDCGSYGPFAADLISKRILVQHDSREEFNSTNRQGTDFEDSQKERLARRIYGEGKPTLDTYLDPTVQHVGISKLRALNVTRLRDLNKTLVIRDNDKPMAGPLKYEHFMAMQEQIR
jgi:hypothetical protein